MQLQREEAGGDHYLHLLVAALHISEAGYGMRYLLGVEEAGVLAFRNQPCCRHRLVLLLSLWGLGERWYLDTENYEVRVWSGLEEKVKEQGGKKLIKSVRGGEKNVLVLKLLSYAQFILLLDTVFINNIALWLPLVVSEFLIPVCEGTIIRMRIVLIVWGRLLFFFKLVWYEFGDFFCLWEFLLPSILLCFCCTELNLLCRNQDSVGDFKAARSRKIRTNCHCGIPGWERGPLFHRAKPMYFLSNTNFWATHWR